MNITPDTLAELERLHAEATTGPWKFHTPLRYGEVTAPAHTNPTEGYDGKLVAESCDAADAIFIAAAHDALPALIARLRELEASLAKAVG